MSGKTWPCHYHQMTIARIKFQHMCHVQPHMCHSALVRVRQMLIGAAPSDHVHASLWVMLWISELHQGCIQEAGITTIQSTVHHVVAAQMCSFQQVMVHSISCTATHMDAHKAVFHASGDNAKQHVHACAMEPIQRRLRVYAVIIYRCHRPFAVPDILPQRHRGMKRLQFSGQVLLSKISA